MDISKTGQRKSRFTTIRVRRETADRLKGYKIGRVSYDDIINDLLELHPPKEVFLEHLKRLRQEKRNPWSVVRENLAI